VRDDEEDEEQEEEEDIFSGTSAQAGGVGVGGSSYNDDPPMSAMTASIDFSAERGIMDQLERERHALRASYIQQEIYGKNNINNINRKRIVLDAANTQQEQRQAPPPPTVSPPVYSSSQITLAPHNNLSTLTARPSPNYRMTSRFSMSKQDEASVVMHNTPSSHHYKNKAATTQQQQQHQWPFSINDNDDNSNPYHAAAVAAASATNIMTSSSQDAISIGTGNSGGGSSTYTRSTGTIGSRDNVKGRTGNYISRIRQQQQQEPQQQQRHYGPGDPSPHHPGIPQGPPEEGIWRETLRRLSSRGVRLTAHGVQCDPRRIWLRFVVDQVSLTWQTEFPQHVRNNDNDNKHHASSSRIVIVRGAIHQIPMSNIIYVEVGKQTAALARTSAIHIPEQTCLSLLTQQGSLDLQCNSRLERDALVSALCFLLDHVQIGIQSNGTDWRTQYIENSTTFALVTPKTTTTTTSAAPTRATAGQDEKMAVNGQRHQDDLLISKSVTTCSDTTTTNRDNSSKGDDDCEDRSSIVALASSVAMPSTILSSSTPLQSGFSSPANHADNNNSSNNRDDNLDIASDLAISPTRTKSASLSLSRSITESIPAAAEF
jgi:hypothetical protein